MAILLGINIENTPLPKILADISNNGKLTNYDSEEAARNALMPPLQTTQKAVLVTVTVDGTTTTYQKTGNLIEPLIKG